MGGLLYLTVHVLHVPQWYSRLCGFLLLEFGLGMISTIILLFNMILLFNFAVEDVAKTGSDFLDGERPALVRLLLILL